MVSTLARLAWTCSSLGQFGRGAQLQGRAEGPSSSTQGSADGEQAAAGRENKPALGSICSEEEVHLGLGGCSRGWAQIPDVGLVNVLGSFKSDTGTAVSRAFQT